MAIVNGTGGNDTKVGDSTDDSIFGGAGNDQLLDNEGNDTLNGGTGNDTMEGGFGDDTYFVDSLSDNLFEISGRGIDTVISSISYDLRPHDNIENLTLTGTAINGYGNLEKNIIIGNANANQIFGQNGEDSLVGGAGDDFIDGGNQNDTLDGGAGADILDGSTGADSAVGGDGNDIYYIDDAEDVISETNANQTTGGIDTVHTILTHQLGLNFENLTLDGAENIDGTGNALKNTIIGNDGNNTLDGKTAADVLQGGKGDDYYVVDLTRASATATTFILEDTVTETKDQGIDTIELRNSNGLTNLQLTGTTTLVIGANIENLFAGSNDIDPLIKLNITGNALNNLIYGSLGDNRIDGLAGDDTMVGETGDDTYVVDSINDSVDESAEKGGNGIDTVEIKIAVSNALTDPFMLSEGVENATVLNTVAYNVTGNALNNQIMGNAAANSLSGGDGNDTLNGLGGTDTLIGGAGDDTFVLDALDTFSDVSGNDTVQVTASINLDDTKYAAIENATLLGTTAINATGKSNQASTLIGNTGNNILLGGAGKDTLAGNAGADTLDGGASVDSMSGGDGNDVYNVDNFDDVVTESNATTAGGIDRVETNLSEYTLGSNIENLTFLLSTNIFVKGNGTGNELANTITGNARDNIIDGLAGIDTLIGGAGDDTYKVDIAKATPTSTTFTLQDSITESASSDVDTIVLFNRNGVVAPTALTTLSINANIENLDASNLGAEFNVNITGNTLNNVITGNADSNILDGLTGADTLVGGAGDDTYIVDNNLDVVDEINSNGAGIDTVQIKVATSNVGVDPGYYILGSGVENATLLNTVAFNVAGNEDDNFIKGNSAANDIITTYGNDTLDGGAGKDTLQGGEGNDTYYIDAIGDVIIDTFGFDTVNASINFTLGNELENLNLLGSTANGTGNAFNNSIQGNAANNSLSGANGNDSLYGGAGSDTMNGGLGGDVMSGGDGNDLYFVDDYAYSSIEGDVGDEVVETNANSVTGGIDTVESSISYELGANIENLKLAGDAYLGVGNNLNNTITGNSNENILDGGAGIDTLIGGEGDDTYYVDIALVSAASGTYKLQDTVTETGSGIDTIVIRNDALLISSGKTTTFTLVANIENMQVAVEDFNLNVLGNTAQNRISGSSGNNLLDGAAGNDTLIGNSGNDTLDGGTGADQMEGGEGDDTYIIDSLLDQAFEDDFSNGFDTLQIEITASNAGASGNSYVLGDRIESAIIANAVAYNVTGNTLNNLLVGNAMANKLVGDIGNDTLVGNGGNDTLDGGAGDDTYTLDLLDTVIDESGIDTAEVTFTINLNDTKYTAVENVNLLGSAAINATGKSDVATVLNGNSGNNSLMGGSQSDVLNGGDGADTLNGGAGTDYLNGGDGNDVYIIEGHLDNVLELEGEGIDRIESIFGYSLGSQQYIENLTVTGSLDVNASGNSLDNIIIGNDGTNSIKGGDGKDSINGGAGNDTLDGETGSDTLTGGAGDDLYYIDITKTSAATTFTLEDIVSEVANQGIDSIILDDRNALAGVALTGISTITIGANIENLDAVGVNNAVKFNVVGNALNNKISGNQADNSIDGGAGNDSIFAGNLYGNDTLDGGTGDDTLRGGAGEDVYYIDSANDVTIDSGPGIDIMYIKNTVSNAGVGGVSYIIGNEIENITLINTVAYNITSNSSDNIIIGNAAANEIRGGNGNDSIVGGAGNDTLFGGGVYTLEGGGVSTVEAGALDTIDGGLGNDSMVGGIASNTYYVDSVGDLISDAGGIDMVYSSAASYTLSDDIEYLTLIGVNAINGTGNALNNLIIGNTGNNILNGGVGFNTLIGGDGNDTYIINDGDYITSIDMNISGESNDNQKTGGIDSVESSISFTLGNNLENLKLTGNTAYIAKGNALKNRIEGNAIDNLLDGDIGADILIGGNGGDYYFVDIALVTPTSTVFVLEDTIIENGTTGTDTIGLSNNNGIGPLSGTTTYNMNTTDTIENFNAALLGDGFKLNVIGNNSNNVITLNDADNSVNGGLGNDSISTSGGDDTLDGSTGNDTLGGGNGNDLYVIDSLSDFVTEINASGIDTIQVKVNTAGATYDIKFTNGAENVTLLNTVNFNIIGYSNDNVLTGNIAANKIEAGDGSDTLIGAGGNDTLIGEQGNDILIGGSGKDILTSGFGADIFDFNALTDSTVGLSHDVITDFSRGQGDKIDLSTIDANSVTAGDQAFSSDVLTGGSFTAIGQLRVVNGMLSGNTDGNFATAEFEVELTGIASLVGTDFIL